MNAGTDALCYLLVSGLRVPVVSTMNAGELYTYFRLRTCQRAQWEIRELATPRRCAFCGRRTRCFFRSTVRHALSPGTCPEGRMCCGKTARVREVFAGKL